MTAITSAMQQRLRGGAAGFRAASARSARISVPHWALHSHSPRPARMSGPGFSAIRRTSVELGRCRQTRLEQMRLLLAQHFLALAASLMLRCGPFPQSGLSNPHRKAVSKTHICFATPLREESGTNRTYPPALIKPVRLYRSRMANSQYSPPSRQMSICSAMLNASSSSTTRWATAPIPRIHFRQFMLA